jgi:DNA-binding NarL/FixJ family response regulator
LSRIITIESIKTGLPALTHSSLAACRKDRLALALPILASIPENQAYVALRKVRRPPLCFGLPSLKKRRINDHGTRSLFVLNSMKPKLFIVDDHLSILRTLECALPLLLPCQIAGTARNAADALKAIPAAAPDVLWVDVGLPGLDGPGLLRVLRSRDIHVKAVLFTGSTDPVQIREAMAANPASFVSKSDDLSCWQKALEAAVQGGSYFSPTISDASRQTPHEGLATLSDVEHVVFSLVVKNVSKEHIADTLGISTHTVRHHRERMMAKLNAHSVAELCTIASRTGMLG